MIIDASITVSWCFIDKMTAEVSALLDRVAEDGAVVPSHWRLEVANALLQGERRKRIQAGDILGRLTLFDALPIEVDHETSGLAWRTILPLARQHRLTVCDAAYLELAARRALPLASLDEELTAAAKKIGVAVLI